MARIYIEPVGCNTFISNFETYLKDNVETTITKYSNALDILSDGVTWKGTGAYVNIKTIIDVYNCFIESYNKLISFFSQDLKAIADYYSQKNIEFGGEGIIVNQLQASVVPTKDLSIIEPLKAFPGLDGDPAKMRNSKEELSSAFSSIKEELVSIQTQLAVIGDASEFLDTSAAEDNPAETIKTTITEVITKLNDEYTPQFETALTNLTTAADSLTH